MHRIEKKSILDKRDIFIQTEKKIPKTTQYPAKPDLLTSLGKGEFDLVPSKLNYLQCNWEICKVNVIYTKAANFPFISTEILSETFIFKQELNIWFLQSESDTWLNNITCLHNHFFMLASKRSFIFTICLNYMQVTDCKSSYIDILTMNTKTFRKMWISKYFHPISTRKVHNIYVCGTFIKI